MKKIVLDTLVLGNLFGNVLMLAIPKELMAGARLSREADYPPQALRGIHYGDARLLQELRKPFLIKPLHPATTPTSGPRKTRAKLLTGGEVTGADAKAIAAPSSSESPPRVDVHLNSAEKMIALFSPKRGADRGTRFRIASVEDNKLALTLLDLPQTTVSLAIVRVKHGAPSAKLLNDSRVESALLHLDKLKHLALVNWDLRWPLRIPHSTCSFSLNHVHLHDPANRSQARFGWATSLKSS